MYASEKDGERVTIRLYVRKKHVALLFCGLSAMSACTCVQLQSDLFL